MTPAARGGQNASSSVKAWVVFSGQADFLLLKLLRPGFRHCFIVMNDGRCWYSLDPMLGYMDIRIYHDLLPDFDLPCWLRARGYAVVPVKLCRPVTRPAFIRLFSCVEAVKRVLGIHARRIFTPWQLYRHLCRQSAFTKVQHVTK